MAGKFIVIEGMDGAGTTTQSHLLVSALKKRGISVVLSAEPTASIIGKEARRLLAMSIENTPDLLVSLALCFAADRMQHVHNTIKPGLLENDFVILDRYVLSSMVYQGLHLPLSFVQEINRFAIMPDITLVLDIDAPLAHKRLAARSSTKDFYESPENLAKIRTRYLHCAEDVGGNTVVMAADGSVEEIHQQIMAVLGTQFGVGQ